MFHHGVEDEFPSHGLKKIPSHFWKVILREHRAIAWIIPNDVSVTRKRIDSYLVSINEIEQRTGTKITTQDYLKKEPVKNSWLIPDGCDKS